MSGVHMLSRYAVIFSLILSCSSARAGEQQKKCLELMTTASPSSLVQWSLYAYESLDRRYPDVVEEFIRLVHTSKKFDFYRGAYPGGIFLSAFMSPQERNLHITPKQNKGRAFGSFAPPDAQSGAGKILEVNGHSLDADMYRGAWKQAWMNVLGRKYGPQEIPDLTKEEIRALKLIADQEKLREKVLLIRPFDNDEDFHLITLNVLPPFNVSGFSRLTGILKMTVQPKNIVGAKVELSDENNDGVFTELVVTLPDPNNEPLEKAIFTALKNGSVDEDVLRIRIPLPQILEMEDQPFIDVSDSEARIIKRTRLTGAQVLDPRVVERPEQLKEVKNPFPIRVRVFKDRRSVNF